MERLSKQRGFLFFVMVIILVVMGILGASTVSVLVDNTKAVAASNASARAFFIAVSGLEIARHDLADGDVACNAITGNALFTNASLFGGQYTVTGIATSAATTLSAGITAVQTTIPLINAAAFTANGSITLDNETIKYTGKSGNSLTGATRGTAPLLHAAGAAVSQSGCTLGAVGGFPTIASPSGLRNVGGSMSASSFSFTVNGTSYSPAITAVNGVSMSGTASITNSGVTNSSGLNGSTVVSNGNVNINNNAQTQVNSGAGVLVPSSTSAGTQGDVATGVSGLTSGPNGLFGLFFAGKTQAEVQATANPAYNENNLDGAAGTTIWITQSLNVKNGDTIGTPANPVILVVLGNVNMNGGTINGFMYVGQSLSMTGGVINGALAVGGNINMNGNNATIAYNQSILSNTGVFSSSTSSGYTSVPTGLGETY